MKAGAEDTADNDSPIVNLLVTSLPIHFTAVVCCVLHLLSEESCYFGILGPEAFGPVADNEMVDYVTIFSLFTVMSCSSLQMVDCGAHVFT